MDTHRRRIFLWALALLLLSNSVGAQEGPKAAADTSDLAWSIVFALPAQDASSIGLWKKVSAGTSLGLELPFGFERRTETVTTDILFNQVDPFEVRNERTQDRGEVRITELTVGLQASLKKYLGHERGGRPFVWSSAFFRFKGIDQDDPVTRVDLERDINGNQGTVSRLRHDLSGWTTEAGVELGTGLEWFPTRSVSVGGHIGLRFAHRGGELGEDTEDAVQTFRFASNQQKNTTTDVSGYKLDLFTSRLRVHFYF